MALLGPDSGCLVEDTQMALKTSQLEREYEKAIGRTTQLLETERSRILNVEQMLLQFENDGLRFRFDQVNEDLAMAMKAESDSQLQLHGAFKEIERLRGIVNTSSNEAESLRTQLESLNSTAVGSQQLLSEKLRLAKDLAIANSEIERLTSQSATSQAILGEKQSLERQLNTLEIELGNERRAHDRAQTKASSQAEEIANLSMRLEETRKELAEEKRIRERHERSSHQQNAEWATQRTNLEGKIEALNKRLRMTKDKLQETQKDVQTQQISTKADETIDSAPKTRTVPLQRPAAPFHPEMTIATPGAVKIREQTKKASALPGDKSAFSITPFLNRTNRPAHSSSSSDDDADDVLAVNANEQGRKPSSKETGTGSDQVPPAPPKDTSNAQKPKPHNLASTSQPRPRDMNKSDDDDEEAEDSVLELVKPKKRKLGAQRDKSLFDDEEGEGDLGFGGVKKPGRKFPPGGRNPISSGLQNPAAGRLQQRGGFGAGFSPLKRDRKRL